MAKSSTSSAKRKLVRVVVSFGSSTVIVTGVCIVVVPVIRHTTPKDTITHTSRQHKTAQDIVRQRIKGTSQLYRRTHCIRSLTLCYGVVWYLVWCFMVSCGVLWCLVVSCGILWCL